MAISPIRIYELTFRRRQQLSLLAGRQPALQRQLLQRAAQIRFTANPWGQIQSSAIDPYGAKFSIAIDPAGKILLNAFPHPNVNPINEGGYNLITDFVTSDPRNQEDLKMDYAIGNNAHLSGRYQSRERERALALWAV